MRKFFAIFLIIFSFLYSKNLQIINLNSYYLKANINEIYNKFLAYNETKALITLLNTFLKNKRFQEYLYFEEMGQVKVSTLSLLQQLKYFLEGWPKYTNTYFDNNSNLAGILKILKDSIENDPNLLNIPQNIINDMQKSIKNLKFFETVKKIEINLNKQNLKNPKNLKEILKNFNLLFSSYVNTLSKIKSPLLDNFNSKIKDKLIREYRIYAKTSLIQIMEIFKKFLNENYESIKNGL